MPIWQQKIKARLESHPLFVRGPRTLCAAHLGPRQKGDTRVSLRMYVNYGLAFSSCATCDAARKVA